MSYPFVIWGLDDEHESNTAHVGEHGITRDDVQDVLEAPELVEESRSSDRLIAFGHTRQGRYISVVFVEIDDATAQPITAYYVDDRD